LLLLLQSAKFQGDGQRACRTYRWFECFHASSHIFAASAEDHSFNKIKQSILFIDFIESAVTAELQAARFLHFVPIEVVFAAALPFNKTCAQ
jgi:hypothetical protein